MNRNALIVGAGDGISASFARALHRDGYAVVLAARNVAKLTPLVGEIRGAAVPCDATDRVDVDRLFAGFDGTHGRLDVVLYNASFRTRGPIESLDPSDVERALMVSAFGGFLVAQAAAKRMLRQSGDVKGAILLTGASASVKGYPQSAPFAMGKFALRGLGQSLARELAPKGIHVCHFVIDGGVRSSRRAEGRDDAPDSLLDPEAIAESYMHVLAQPRTAWTSELELRPWVERF
jgi:NAD(P)-dependent dehydrogenase (short-subunit alcohol dehydrogenase family)